MKVLLVADAIEGAHMDAAGLGLSELAVQLIARGHLVQVVCARPLETWQTAEALEGVTCWRPSPEHLSAALVQALSTAPDVVHVAATSPLGARFAGAVRSLPHLLDLWDVSAICPNGDLLRRPGLEPCSVHYPHADCGACAGLLRLRAMGERTPIAQSAAVVIARTAWARARAAEALARPVHRLEPGVDTLRFRPDPSPPLSPDVAALWTSRETLRVLFLGPPSFVRGGGRITDLLVALHSRAPDAELVVAGRDPADPDGHQVLLAEAKEMGLSASLRLVPEVAPADLPALLASCTLACLPAHSPGANHVHALQALATGLPIVAFEDACTAEVIQQGREGVLARPGDIVGMATAIGALLGDRQARDAFGERARLTAIEHFDLGPSVLQIEELYRSAQAPRARDRAAA